MNDTHFRRILAILCLFGFLVSSLSWPAIAAGASTDPGRGYALEEIPADEAEFYELLESAIEHQPAFGPVKGMLFHEPGEVTIVDAEVSLSDFFAHVDCESPEGDTRKLWDCGFEFRDLDGGPHYRLIVFSDGLWGLAIGNGSPIVKGNGIAALDESGNHMTIDLAVSGSKGYFAVNQQFISSLDVGELAGPGSVGAGTAFFADTFIEGAVTTYYDFIVWSLDRV